MRLACISSVLLCCILVFAPLLYMYQSYVEIPYVYTSANIATQVTYFIPNILVDYLYPAMSEYAIAPEYSTTKYNNQFHEAVLYRYKSDVYTVALDSIESFKEQDEYIYAIYKNDILLTRVQMCYGVSFPIVHAYIVNDSLAFTYLFGDCNQPLLSSFYQDREWRYNGNPVQHIFSYNDKIGFIANILDDHSVHVFYDGKIISDGFDSIPIISCCLPDVFPRFNIYDDGTLLFIGKRDMKNFLVKSHL